MLCSKIVLFAARMFIGLGGGLHGIVYGVVETITLPQEAEPDRLRCSIIMLAWRSLFAKPGGWGGIRTHGTVARTPVFKTSSLNHSDTRTRTSPEA